MSTVALPAGFSDLLPRQAWRVEGLRRGFIDAAHASGYRLVMPALIESSQAVADEKELSGQCFDFADAMSLERLVLRADITPQIKRIDAHFSGQASRRYCYVGEVIHRRARSGSDDRELLQAGVEVLGQITLETDLEALSLLLNYLAAHPLGADWVLVLGHAGVLKQWLEHSDKSRWEQIQQAVARADSTALEALVPQAALAQWQLWLSDPLASLSADNRAETAELLEAYRRISSAHPEVRLSLYPAFGGSYGYHCGLVYALYRRGLTPPLAAGGRYPDGTGFSLDLRALALVGES